VAQFKQIDTLRHRSISLPSRPAPATSTMRTLGIREVRQRYEILKETLDAEGEVILTHHGKPFARVLPIEPVKPRKRWKPHPELADIPFQQVPSEVYVAEDREDRV